MRRLTGLLAAVGAAILIALAVLPAPAPSNVPEAQQIPVAAGEPETVVAEPVVTAAAPGPVPEEQPEPEAELGPPPAPDSIRNVTPAGILPHPPVTGPLKRVTVAKAPAVTEKPPETLKLTGPLVIDAGTIQVKHLTIHLAGLDAPDLSETCPSRLGGTWPCGVRARTALRALVQRSTVVCDDLVEIGTNALTARCSRGTRDLAAWMVEQGWARPAEDAHETLHQAAAAAKEARRGLWQLDGPQALPPTTSALPQAEIPLPPVEIVTEEEAGSPAGAAGATAAAPEDIQRP